MYTDIEKGHIINDPTAVEDAGNEAKGKRLNDKIEKGLKQEDSIWKLDGTTKMELGKRVHPFLFVSIFRC